MGPPPHDVNQPVTQQIGGFAVNFRIANDCEFHRGRDFAFALEANVDVTSCQEEN